LATGVGHGEKCLVEQRDGLGEVDDVDVVAGAVDERRHLRVPAVGLMTKMHASLKQLAHRNIRQCHGTAFSFFRFLPPREDETGFPVTGASVRALEGLAALRSRV
jgi:hypothetical protein